MKALLITIVALLVGALLLAGAGYIAWQHYGDDFIADSRAGIEEGIAYAKTASDRDCYQRTLHKLNACNGFSCTIRTKLFAEHCMKHAATITDFCDDIPGATSFIDFAFWSADTCADEAPDNSGCDSVLQEVGKHCMRVHRDSNAAQDVNGDTGPTK